MHTHLHHPSLFTLRTKHILAAHHLPLQPHNPALHLPLRHKRRERVRQARENNAAAQHGHRAGEGGADARGRHGAADDPHEAARYDAEVRRQDQSGRAAWGCAGDRAVGCVYCDPQTVSFASSSAEDWRN